MSFTHRLVLPLAGIAAALSMVTISLAAETTPPTPAGHAGLPAACQQHVDATPTATVAPPTATVTHTEDEDDDDDGEVKSIHREAIRACIEALRAEGKEHTLGEIMALIARARAERNAHAHEHDDDRAPTATATATPTASTTAEHHTRHTPPPTHHRD